MNTPRVLVTIMALWLCLGLAGGGSAAEAPKPYALHMSSWRRVYLSFPPMAKSMGTSCSLISRKACRRGTAGISR